MKLLNHSLLAILLMGFATSYTISYSNAASAEETSTGETKAVEACKTDASLRIKDQTALVQLAIDERTRRYGLMFRASMGEHCGMLFVFDNTRTRVFTMRNTLIPLDIAFIDEEGRIGEIFTMQPGGDRYPSTVTARYALEMNEGWFEANDIKVDDLIQVAIEPDELKPIGTVSELKTE